jgi:transcriptional regulator with XRE-family HTH domain
MVYGDLVAMATLKNAQRKKHQITKRASPGGIFTLLGKEVRRRRRKLKLTQVNLSVQAGYSPNIVGRLERGVYNPSLGMLEAIAKRLGAPVYALFLNTDLLDIWVGLHDEENFPSGLITELRWRRV